MTWFRAKWEDEMEYILVGHEHHEIVGEHLHVVVIFLATKEVRQRTFDILNEGDVYHPNIQTARSLRNVIEYTQKDGDWCDWGVSPLLQTKMTRLEKINFIRTHDIDEIMNCGLFGLSELNNALRLKQQMTARVHVWPNYQKRRVFWFHGSTGSGKTRMGMRIVRGCRRWVKLNGSLRTFMNGYTGQDGVLIDDLRAGSIDFETLLSILDGYPTFVNVKGGCIEWLANTVVITAPKRPEEIFYDHVREQPWDKVDQLLRRIDTIRDFDERRYGDEAGDETTVEMHDEEIQTMSPNEAVLIPEETLSVIPGSLQGEVRILDGIVHPCEDN